jgi:hypothetical protein
MNEADLMRSIMIALSNDGHFVCRANVGLFFTQDGRPIRSGLPVGFSDLFGNRRDDAKAFYLEVKTPTGKVTTEQMAFINAMKIRGAIAGVVRSIEDAQKLLR